MAKSRASASAAADNLQLYGVLRKILLHAQEAQLTAPGAVAQARPLSDPQSQMAANLQSLNAPTRLVYGVITDATPVGQVYRVQLEKLKLPMPAVYMPRTTTGRFGVTEFTSLQPGSSVWCVVHEGIPYATIIGVIPPINIDPSRALFGILHTSTRSRVDTADMAPLRMENHGNVPSFSAGRPYDAIMGDYGAMSETGCRILIDSFMAQLGVTEMSQLTFYHHDMLGKLAAYNFMHWTAASEREALNDQDEVSDWTGYAVYPWEQMGYLRRNRVAEILSAKDWQKDYPSYSKMEPVDDYAMPFHREREWHGYLGQGGRRSVCGMPYGSTSESHLSYAGGDGIQSPKLPGLADDVTLLDGRRLIQSAKGISVAKRPLIIQPVRRRRPDDPTGDTSENYTASGSIGNGAQHKITGDIEVTGREPSQVRAAGIMDMHAYFYNYAANQPFVAHTQDYSVPEEADAAWVAGKSELVPSFAELRQNMYINTNNYRMRMTIDERYGEQQFGLLPCGYDMLDDGGFVLYGGCGEEIRLSGGSVTISAPGDVWLKPGRNANIWAGDDINAKARNSVDVIATNHDVRLKSEKNMQLISGNSGYGGLLLESKARSMQFDFTTPGEQAITSGVLLKAAGSVVAAWSQDIYLRTGSDDGSISNGLIYLDAGKGTQQIVTVSSNVTHNVQHSFQVNYAAVPGEVQKSTFFSENVHVLCSQALINGATTINGGVYAKGSLFSTEGNVYTAKAESSKNLVPSLQGDSLTKVIEIVALAQDYAEKTIPESANEIFKKALTDRIYITGGVGNDDVITKAAGTLRADSDYSTGNFVIYEDRWQQQARLDEQVMQAWEEKPVTVDGKDTYPYPGESAYNDSADVLKQQDPTMFDVQEGRSYNRANGDQLNSVFAAPAFGVATGVSLNTYKVLGAG